jgi:3-hydroxy-9,10-secoandrosta-1,3,5(10)-triene-9,17-dione monooxygenase
VNTDTLTTGPAIPTGEEGQRLVAAARALAPALRESALEAERLGRLPDEVARAVHEAGFFGLHVPTALGGAGASIGTAVAVYEELARGSGAAAWCAMLLSSGGLVASRLSSPGRSELWAEDPRAGVCASVSLDGTARPVPGGLRVSGTWTPLSGIHHARWVFAPVVVTDDREESEQALAVLLPVREVRVQRTWHVAGMAATGSDTAVADDVFVPAVRTAPLADLLGGPAVHVDEPLSTVDVHSASAVGAGALLVGMGRAALEQVLTALGRGETGGVPTRAGARDVPGVRLDVATAARLVDTAGLHLARATADVDGAVADRRPLDPPTRARVRADVATISTSTREAIGHLLDAGGSRSFGADEALQRIWRDVEVVSRHPVLAPGVNLDVYARSLLGVEELEEDL